MTCATSVAAEAEAKPTTIQVNKVGRNESCPCGSGKKFKRCCIGKPAPFSPTPNAACANTAGHS